jgi:hypothetical protein
MYNNIIVCRDPNTTVNEAYLEVVKETLSDPETFGNEAYHPVGETAVDSHQEVLYISMAVSKYVLQSQHNQ